MKMKNPLRNFLTPDEQKILLFLGLIILGGCFLDYFGWNTLQATPTDLDTLRQAVKEDKPLQLDIRIATFEELLCLSGIGEKRAKDIIAYRETNPFTSVNQIMNIKGIGLRPMLKFCPIYWSLEILQISSFLQPLLPLLKLNPQPYPKQIILPQSILIQLIWKNYAPFLVLEK